MRKKRKELSRTYRSPYERITNGHSKVNPVISMGNGLILSPECAGRTEVGAYTGEDGDEYEFENKELNSLKSKYQEDSLYTEKYMNGLLQNSDEELQKQPKTLKLTKQKNN